MKVHYRLKRSEVECCELTCFLREARLAARLRHSNVASVLHLATVDLPPLTVVEAAVVKTTGDMTGDELLKLVETMGSPIQIPRELLHLRKENARLQKENTNLREVFQMDEERRSIH
jgi:hypothetical protein